MDASISTRMLGGRMNGIKGEEQHTIGKRYTQKTIAETFELSHSHQALGTEDNLFFARLS